MRTAITPPVIRILKIVVTISNVTAGGGSFNISFVLGGHVFAISRFNMPFLLSSCKLKNNVHVINLNIIDIKEKPGKMK